MAHLQAFYPVHVFVRADPDTSSREMWFHLAVPWVLSGQFKFRADALKTIVAVAEGAEAIQYSMRLGDAVSFYPGFSEDIVSEFPGLEGHGGFLLVPGGCSAAILPKAVEEEIERPFSFIASFRRGCYWKFKVNGQDYVTGGVDLGLFDSISFKSEELAKELIPKYEKEIQNA